MIPRRTAIAFLLTNDIVFNTNVSLLARGEIDYFADSLLLETGKQEDPEADEATA